MFCPSLARVIGLVLALQCAITKGQLSPSPGNAAVPYSKVLSFGDSWTYLGDKPLKEALAPYGVNVSVTGIPGTPAGFWRLIAPKKLANDVTKSGAQAVVLSIGGDDFLEALPYGGDKDKILAEMLNSTRVVLDALFAVHPDIHVYQWGYDLLSWSASEYCQGFGDTELKKCCCPKGWKDVECMTSVQIEYLQTKYVDALHAEYAHKHNYHGLNLVGSLQVAGGVMGAAVGKPVLSQYPPPQFVIDGPSSNPWACLHLTPSGFSAMYAQLVKQMGFQ